MKTRARIYFQLGNLLHLARLDKKLSIRALGKITGLDKTTVSNIENGTGALVLHNIILMGAALGAASKIGRLIEKAIKEFDEN